MGLGREWVGRGVRDIGERQNESRNKNTSQYRPLVVWQQVRLRICTKEGNISVNKCNATQSK